VIFYDITGFQRRGFLQIISIYPNLTLHWNNGKSLAKNQNGKEIEQGIKPWIRNG
jgi:hypothetical protein